MTTMGTTTMTMEECTDVLETGAGEIVMIPTAQHQEMTMEI